jgi:hypothetical protein
VQKRSMNSKGHGMMVALVILATRGPLRRSERRAQTVLYLTRNRLSDMEDVCKEQDTQTGSDGTYLRRCSSNSAISRIVIVPTMRL